MPSFSKNCPSRNVSKAVIRNLPCSNAKRLPRRFFPAGVLLAAALGSGAVSAQGPRDEPDRLALTNARSTIVLDKKANGAVVSLVDHATGRELVERDPASPLFRLAFSQPGDPRGDLVRFTSLDAGSVAYAPEGHGSRSMVRLTFRKLGGRQMEAECVISAGPDDDKFRWQFALKGPEHLVLEEVQFPVVVLRTPSRDDDAATDAFVAGAREGGVYPRPGRWPVNTRMGFNQPGTLAAQFSCYSDASGGFYSATQDSRGYPKRLNLERTGSGLEHAWHRHCYHDMSAPFELGYDVVQAVFRSRDPAMPCDWRDAADLYKAWALTQPWCVRTLAQRDDLPEWIKQGPAMVRFRRRHTYYEPNVRLEHHPDWYSQPEHIEGWLQGYWQRHHAGVPLIVTFWGWEHLASWIAPKYFPPYPSEDGLRRRIEAVRKVGGHPFFWPSGYHWASSFHRRGDGTFEWEDGGHFGKTGSPHSVVTRGGTPFARTDFWLGGGTNHLLCCGEPWTRRWLDETAVALTQRGADLIQIDQVTHGCSPQERGCCYSRDHAHPPGPGSWFVEAFSGQLQSMREATRQQNRETILGFEGPQEFHLQQIGIQDYRDFEVFWQPRLGREPAPVFAYLYHEFIPLFQSNPEGFRGKPQGGNMLLMAYSLVNGQMPHLVPHWPLEPAQALRNGGFEAWDGETPAGWSRGEPIASVASRDESNPHGGRFSLRLENRSEDEAVLVTQSIGVGEHEREVGSHGPEAGKSYRLGLWFRAEALRGAGRIEIEAVDACGAALGNWPVPLKPGAGWQRAEATFAIPKGSVRLLIRCRLAGNGRAWLDDLALDESGGDGTFRPVLEKPILPAEHDLAQQWVRLFHGEGRPYLLFGRMLHPPRLTAGKTLHTGSQPVDARVPVHLYGSGGATVQTAAIDIPADTGWVQREVELTISEPAERCVVNLFFRVKGTFWFDDIRLTEMASGREVLPNGDFERWPDPAEGPAGWAVAREWAGLPCTGTLHRDPEQKRRGDFALRLANAAEGNIVHLSQTLPVDGKTLERGKTYRLSLWMKVEDAGRLERELPAVLHNAYRAPDGSEAAVLANITGQKQAVALEWQGKTVDLELAPWQVRLIR